MLLRVVLLVHHTGESIIPNISKSPGYASLHGDSLPGVQWRITPPSPNRKFCLPLVAFKGTIRRNHLRGGGGGEHHVRKYWSIKCLFTKHNILTLRSQNLLTLWSNISENHSNHEKMKVENIVTHSLKKSRLPLLWRQLKFIFYVEGFVVHYTRTYVNIYVTVVI